MKTDRDMRESIIRTLDEGAVGGSGAYDVDAIVAACHEALRDSTDSWDLELLSANEFWWIVEAIDTNATYTDDTTPEAKAPMTGQELLRALMARHVQRTATRQPHHYGRFMVLEDAVSVLHPDWSDEKVNTWLYEELQEMYANLD